MNTRKSLLHSVLLMAALAAASLSAAPLGTAFTYQGRLDQNGQPATNGIYQMNFALFANATGGGSLGSNTILTVSVNNGLFAVRNIPSVLRS